MPTDSAPPYAAADDGPSGGAQSSFGPRVASSLDWLLDPVPVAAFLHRHWETDELLVGRNAPTYFQELPGLNEIDELITATSAGSRRSREDGRLVRAEPDGALTQRPIGLCSNGTPDIHEVYHAYHDGFSVVVNNAHRRSLAIARLCRGLEEVLHHRVGANLYLTPRNGRGLLPHVDTHDVFVLQLHGAKHWRVGDPPETLPLADAKVVPGRWHNPRDYVLEAGDVLYLPRGFAHEAGTASSSSLHLTLGVYVHRWVDAMVEALRVLADGDVELRAGLPVGFLDRPLDPAIVAAFAGRLSHALGDSAVTEAARTRLGVAMLTGGRATGGHFRSLDAIADLSGDSVVVPVAGVRSRVRCTASEAVLEFDTNFVSGPLDLVPAFRFVAERRRFCVDDLPGGLLSRDKLDLVGRLVAEGYLTCVQDGEGGKLDGQRRNVDRAAR